MKRDKNFLYIGLLFLALAVFFIFTGSVCADDGTGISEMCPPAAVSTATSKPESVPTLPDKEDKPKQKPDPTTTSTESATATSEIPTATETQIVLPTDTETPVPPTSTETQEVLPSSTVTSELTEVVSTETPQLTEEATSTATLEATATPSPTVRPTENSNESNSPSATPPVLGMAVDIISGNDMGYIEFSTLPGSPRVSITKEKVFGCGEASEYPRNLSFHLNAAGGKVCSGINLKNLQEGDLIKISKNGEVHYFTVHSKVEVLYNTNNFNLIRDGNGYDFSLSTCTGWFNGSNYSHYLIVNLLRIEDK